MKYLILALIIVAILISPAFAKFYIVSQDNIIVSTTDYLPDAQDLESRNEIAVYSDEEINFAEAEYRNSKIIKHKETSAEKKEKADKEKKLSDRKAARASANAKLKALGLTEEEVEALTN